MSTECALARRIVVDPDPLEPYRIAAGYRVGDLLFLSGQGAVDEKGQLVGIGDLEAQAARTFDNLDRAVAGSCRKVG